MSRWEQWTRRLIKTVWEVDDPVLLMVNIAPMQCIQLMKTASKPSVSRLHHRNLFADGRRYQLEAITGGFRMTTTHKIWWQRRRSAFSAVMNGLFTPFGDDLFQVQLKTHIRLFYFLDIFLLPVFMTSILIYTPWHPLVIITLSLLLFGLSWRGHRLNVALEANEMVWFVRIALQDHLAQVDELPSDSPYVVALDHDFDREWERFYQSKKGEG
ncbi:MAG: hypothetical protein KJ043_04150 [Anaerolineae bacterium]|nr:hypothetical protein [Anaerolineae bacterium]